MEPPNEEYNPKRIGGITALPIEHPRCPKCGATLLFNGSLVWCTFIGSSTEKACDFGIGIHRNITRSEATALWWKSLDIGQRLTDDQIAMFRGSTPIEEVNGLITVEIEEATTRRPKRAVLGFYNQVDYHISVEQAIALARDILRKTGNEDGYVALWQRLAEQKESARMWKVRAAAKKMFYSLNTSDQPKATHLSKCHEESTRSAENTSLDDCRFDQLITRREISQPVAQIYSWNGRDKQETA